MIAMISAETKAYREDVVSRYDEQIARIQADVDRDLGILDRLKQLRVWAEAYAEPPVFRPVSEALEEARRKVAANPDSQQAKDELAFFERVAAGPWIQN
jgi:hypothetical protein